MPRREACHCVSPVRFIAGEKKLSVWKPLHQHRQWAVHNLCCGLVTSPLGRASFLITIQNYEDRQSERSVGLRKLDKGSQYDPLVTAAKDSVGVRTANGIAVPSLFVNRLATMTVDGFIANNLNGPIGRDAIDHKANDHLGEPGG